MLESGMDSEYLYVKPTIHKRNSVSYYLHQRGGVFTLFDSKIMQKKTTLLIFSTKFGGKVTHWQNHHLILVIIRITLGYG